VVVRGWGLEPVSPGRGRGTQAPCTSSRNGKIVLGLLAGIIAKAVFPGADGLGITLTTLLGIGGALLGGLVASVLGFGDPIDEFFDVSTWIAAILGAIAILRIASALGGRGRRRGLLT